MSLTEADREGAPVMIQESIFPAFYSALSASALQEHLLSLYTLGAIHGCRLFNVGVNDTYFVFTETGKYVLRVYRHGLHTYEHILFEIDALTHLQLKSVPVAAPLAKTDGGFITVLNAVEGERYAVLFQSAPGGRFQQPCAASEVYAYGRTIAQMHNGWDDFQSVHTGHQYSLDDFLDTPLKTFLPILANRPGEARYLLELVIHLKQRFAQLSPETLAYGVCHGDLHGGNANITADQIVTFYDFEFIGKGWQAIDLAAFYWAIQRYKQSEVFWGIFLEGYISRRPVGERDRKAIPLFVLLRHIFLVGLHSRYLDAWGSIVMDDRYLNLHLAFIRACAERL